MTPQLSKHAEVKTHIQIRVTAEQKRVMIEAAKNSGQNLSNWLRGLAMKEARRLGVK
jgi:uncharacterized protein (DUF1778 family)